MSKYLYAIALVLLLFSHVIVYQQGKDVERRKTVKVALEYREKENRLLAELQATQAKKEIVYRDRTKVVERVISQCADIDIDHAILSSLLNAISP